MNGFRIFCDHRNLSYIFSPFKERKQTSERLARWCDHLLSFNYLIEHISGIDNIWADLMTRWGPSSECLNSIVASVPFLDPSEWPSIEEIEESQAEFVGTHPDDIPEGKVWIPPNKSLRTRLMIIGHCSISGHLQIQATIEKIGTHFWWESMEEDVKAFVTNCLHCITTKSGPIPRPLGEAVHGSRPNEVLHYDFLHVGKSEDGYVYVLVIKDDLSNFVELIPSKTADHFVVADALLDWAKRFGVPDVHVSDNGSHFKNSVINELTRLMNIRHHFVVAHSPMSNGTVEVVNRLLLQVLQTLCSKFMLQFKQ